MSLKKQRRGRPMPTARQMLRDQEHDQSMIEEELAAACEAFFRENRYEDYGDPPSIDWGYDSDDDLYYGHRGYMAA